MEKIVAERLIKAVAERAKGFTCYRLGGNYEVRVIYEDNCGVVFGGATDEALSKHFLKVDSPTEEELELFKMTVSPRLCELYLCYLEVLRGGE